MPLKQCTQDGRSGWQWGDAGTCYTGPQARQRALRQAAAIRASGYTGNARRPTQADLDAPAVGTKANPLALDPTRTTLLRRRYMAEMNKRFRALRGAIWRTIVQEDALGLGKAKPFIFQANAAAGLTTNNKWAFLSDPDKAEAFQDWFEQQVQQDVFAPIPGAAPLTPADLAEPVPVVDPSAPWQAEFVESAYMKGVTQAYADTHAEAMAAGLSPAVFEGGQQAFLASSFSGKVRTSKLKLLAQRNFQQLKGVTAAMGQALNRILSDGLVAGHNPTKIASTMNKEIESITKKRALTIAKTEIIHAHAEGQLDSFSELGVQEVGALAEWATAGDGKVCDKCSPLEGSILTIKEARGLIPRHPNCRCMWLPAGVGEATTGQTWAKDIIDFQFRNSMKAETGEQDGKKARAKSKWLGSTKKISDKGKLKPTKKNKAKAAADLEAKKAAKAAEAAAAKAKAAELAAARAAAKAKAAELTAKKKAAGRQMADLQKRYGLEPGAFGVDAEGVAVLSPAGKEAIAKAKAAKAAAKAKEAAAAEQSQKVKVGMAKSHFTKKLGLPDEAIATDVQAGDGTVHLLPGYKFEALNALGFNGTEDPLLDLTDPNVLEFFKAQDIVAQKDAILKIKHPLYSKPPTPAQTDPELKAWLGGSSVKHRALGELDLASTGMGWGGDGPKSYGGVIMDEKGRVLLREPKGHFGGYSWTWPKGGVKAGQNPVQAALDEVAEETGHKGRIVGMVPGGFEGDTSTLHMFLMKSEGFDHTKMDAETKGMRWVTKDEAEKLIKTSKNKKGRDRDLAILQAAYDTAAIQKKQEISQSDTFGPSVQAKAFDIWSNKQAAPSPPPDAPFIAPFIAPDEVPDQAAIDAAVAKALAAKAKARAKASRPKVKAGIVLGPEQNHEDDDFWDSYLAAAKTVSHHAEDKQYNAATISQFNAAAQKAEDLLNKGGLDPDTEAMLVHYIQAADKINNAKAAGKKLAVGEISKFTYQPEIKPPGPGDITPVSKGFKTGATYKVTGTNLGGSTGAKKVRVTTRKPWGPSGSDWVLKDYSGRSIQAENEFLANGIYNLVDSGIAPESQLGLIQNRNGDVSTGVFNKWLEGGTQIGSLRGQKQKDAYLQAQDGFVLDAWLGNWDAVGMGGDNMMVVDGKVVRIDNGGSLLFRAQGGLKGKQFGSKVTELDSLLDANTNPNAAKVYKGITKRRIADQIEKLEDAVAKAGGIDQFLLKAGIDNISDTAQRREIRTTLTERFHDLVETRDKIEGLTRIPLSQRVNRPQDVQVRKRNTDTAKTKLTATRKTKAAIRKDNLDVREVVNFSGHSFTNINREHLAAIREGKVTGKRAKDVNDQLSRLPGFSGVVGRGENDSVTPEQWEAWKRGDWAQSYWSCPSSTSAKPTKVFKSNKDGVCYIVMTKGKRNGWIMPISQYSPEHEALMMGDSAFRVRGWAEQPKAEMMRHRSGHWRFLIVEEMKEGEIPPESQQAPPEFTMDEVWQAFTNDSERAKMGDGGDADGKGIADILKDREPQ